MRPLLVGVTFTRSLLSRDINKSYTSNPQVTRRFDNYTPDNWAV